MEDALAILDALPDSEQEARRRAWAPSMAAMPCAACESSRRPARGTGKQPSLLDQIPPDAPMDDATLTVWNGERFVANDSWRATAPIQCDEPAKPEYPTDAARIVSQCGAAPGSGW